MEERKKKRLLGDQERPQGLSEPFNVLHRPSLTMIDLLRTKGPRIEGKKGSTRIRKTLRAFVPVLSPSSARHPRRKAIPLNIHSGLFFHFKSTISQAVLEFFKQILHRYNLTKVYQSHIIFLRLRRIINYLKMNS